MSKTLFVDTVYERAHKLAQALQENYDRNGYSRDTVFDIKEGRKYINGSAARSNPSSLSILVRSSLTRCPIVCDTCVSSVMICYDVTFVLFNQILSTLSQYERYINTLHCPTPCSLSLSSHCLTHSVK